MNKLIIYNGEQRILILKVIRKIKSLNIINVRVKRVDIRHSCEGRHLIKFMQTDVTKVPAFVGMTAAINLFFFFFFICK